MADDSNLRTRDEVLELLPSLRAYARALHRNPVDADDLVQETLLKALANIDHYRPGTMLRAWLFTIMRNSFYTYARKRAREQPAAAECASGWAVSQPDHDRVIQGKRVLEAINRLPGHYREALVLVVMLGQSYQEAAEICGVEIGTVKSRLNRARRLVIAEIGQDALETFGGS
jgi:RNA polymerase sigma-70 factor (ECF subfamily)